MRRWIHRSLALALAGVMLGSGALAAVTDFTDVPADAWYHEDLESLVQAGSIHGVGEGRFEPDSPLTMAQLLKLLGCLLWPGEAEAPTGGEAWFAPHVALAEEKKLSEGLTLTDENIEDVVSRYDLAVVAVNAARLRGETPEMPEAAIPYIGDWAAIPESYRATVAEAYSLGLLQGNDGTGNFGGNEPLTRCQICAVAMRLVEPERRPERTFRSLADYAGSWMAGDLQLEVTAEGAVTLTRGGLTAGPLAGTRAADHLRLGEFRDSAGTRYVGVVYLLEDSLYLQLSTVSSLPDDLSERFTNTILTRKEVAPEGLENQYYTALAGEDAPADALGLLLLNPKAEQLETLGSYTDLRAESGCEALIVPRYVGSWVRIYDGDDLQRTMLAGDQTTGMLCSLCDGLGRGYSAYLTWSANGASQMVRYSFSCDMSGESAGTVAYFC